MLRSTGTCIFLVFACFKVYADKTADDARFLKWSQGLNTHFKSGFPKENILSIDPYNVEKPNRVFSALALGTYNNAKLSMQLTDYKIKGLGDRKVINASTTYRETYYKNHPVVRVSCYVTYNEITVEGKFVIFPSVNSSSIANVTGNLKFTLSGKTLSEKFYFNGTEGQATEYKFLGQFLSHNPHYDPYTDYNQEAFTFSGVPKELENFVRSEFAADWNRKSEIMMYNLIFSEGMISNTRHEICFHAWDNKKLIYSMKPRIFKP